MYILHYKGKGIMLDHPDFDGDWLTRYFPDFRAEGFDRPEAIRVYGTFGDPALPYTSELVNCNGAHFTLVAHPEHTDADIDRAKADCRGKQDVVGLTVVRIREWVAPPVVAMAAW